MRDFGALAAVRFHRIATGRLLSAITIRVRWPPGDALAGLLRPLPSPDGGRHRGRAPGTQAEFGELIKAWVAAGAECP